MNLHPKLKPGDVLGGRYRILRKLGQGGMGTVFLAEDGRLPGKLWAVKELHARIKDSSEFADEACFLAECSHPGLAAIADFYPPDSNSAGYLVMEYIQGETLERMFQRERPFAWWKAVRMAVELCEVLGYLHEGRPRPIIYRDLKPSNIMLDQQGRVRLIDFGTARHYDRNADSDTIHLGTPGFAAPEQLLGKQTDARSDLYTLGAVLNYLLSGGRQYDPNEIKREDLRDGAPDELNGIIRRLLETDPAKRFQRAAEVRQRLLALEDDSKEIKSESGLRTSIPPNQQLIVIGGLTPGSGGTFLAVALARVLNRLAIPHAALEFPGANPDLYHILLGENKAPKNYTYRSEAVRSHGICSDGGVVWKDGYTEWVPLPPNRPVSEWSSELTNRLLACLPQPVVIADVGSAWLNGETEDLCRRAALIMVVCGPSPVHLCRTTASQAWMKLMQLQQEQQEVMVIANRSAKFDGMEDWLRSLPATPKCHIPEFSSEDVLSSLWKGELYADRPKIISILEKALEPAAALIRSRLIKAKEVPAAKRRFWQVIGG